MELRSDIAAAAARLTSSFDVNREIRQLGAYLRDGESVHQMACGVYGPGSGLLVLTDHRVLLLRDGRSGQASEGFPLGRLSSVEWAPGAARGTITVSDFNSTAELSQVDLAEGAEMVELVRSLMAVDEDDALDEDEGDEEDDHELITHSSTVPVQRTQRSGRFAVQMRLRTPTPAEPSAAAEGEPAVVAGSVPRAVEDTAVDDERPAADPRAIGLVGEVPIAQLVAEETVGVKAVPAQASTVGGTGGYRTSPRVSSTDESEVVSPTGPTRLESSDGPPATRSRRRATGRRKTNRVWLGAAAVGLVGLAGVGGIALLANQSGSPAAVSPAPTAADSAAGPSVTVTKIVDADTVEVSGPVTGVVDILGIVAPRADKGQCGAADSTAFAKRALDGATVTLVTDPSQPAADKSGRKLAFLKVAPDTDYSVLIARAGLARYYDSGQPVALASEIKAAQAEAERTKLGLWGSPCNGKLNASGASSSAGAATNTNGSAAVKPARAVTDGTTAR